jgi:hypothetical protein
MIFERQLNTVSITFSSIFTFQWIRDMGENCREIKHVNGKLFRSHIVWLTVLAKVLFFLCLRAWHTKFWQLRLFGICSLFPLSASSTNKDLTSEIIWDLFSFFLCSRAWHIKFWQLRLFGMRLLVFQSILRQEHYLTTWVNEEAAKSFDRVKFNVGAKLNSVKIPYRVKQWLGEGGSPWPTT